MAVPDTAPPLPEENERPILAEVADLVGKSVLIPLDQENEA
jgi:hypothetical protein